MTLIQNILDEMGNRIDELEKNIADLINQSGSDEPHHGRWRKFYKINYSSSWDILNDTIFFKKTLLD